MRNTGYESIMFLVACLRQVASRGSYFETSASHILTPPEALEEAKEALIAYHSEPLQTWKAVSFALERCQSAISRSVLNHAINQLPSTRIFLQDVKEFIFKYEKLNERAKAQLLQQEASKLGSLVKNAAVEISEPYYDQLTDRAVKALSANNSQATNRDKAHKIAPELAAALYYQGRDVDSLATRIEEECQGLLENPGSQTAEKLVRHQLAAQKHAFYVATVMTGAVSASIAPNLDGRTIKFPGPISWVHSQAAPRHPQSGKKFSPAPSRQNIARNKFADADLAHFCFEHWKTTSAAPSSQHKIPSQIVVWKVSAWDYEQARQIALDKAESVMDLVNAEHRTGEFGVKRKVLIWEVGSKTTNYITDSPQAIYHTRKMRRHSSPSVQRSLRFASRAASERAGAMAVFFGWVALEYLGRGNAYSHTPQNFIAKFAPKVIAMAALHHLANEVSFSLTRHISLREMPTNLRTVLKLRNENSDLLNQRHLLFLLTAPQGMDDDNEAAETLARNLGTSVQKALAAKRELTKLISQLTELEQYKIRKVRNYFRSAAPLATYLRKVEEYAEVTLQRMRYVRNQTAHSSVPESLRYRMLSNATREILDTCYQALDNDYSNSPPSETLHTIARNYDNLLKSLNSDNLALAFSPHLALRPNNPLWQ